MDLGGIVGLGSLILQGLGLFQQSGQANQANAQNAESIAMQRELLDEYLSDIRSKRPYSEMVGQKLAQRATSKPDYWEVWGGKS